MVIGRVASSSSSLEDPFGANTTQLRDTFLTVLSSLSSSIVLFSLSTFFTGKGSSDIGASLWRVVVSSFLSTHRYTSSPGVTSSVVSRNLLSKAFLYRSWAFCSLSSVSGMTRTSQSFHLSLYSCVVSVSLRGMEAARGPGSLDSTSSNGAIEVYV